MLPTERRHVGDQIVGDDFAARAQLVGGAAEIDGVPEDDGGDGKVEAGGAVALIFESPIADFVAPAEPGATGAGSSLLKRCVLWCSKLFLVIRRRPGL